MRPDTVFRRFIVGLDSSIEPIGQLAIIIHGGNDIDKSLDFARSCNFDHGRFALCPALDSVRSIRRVTCYESLVVIEQRLIFR